MPRVPSGPGTSIAEAMASLNDPRVERRLLKFRFDSATVSGSKLAFSVTKAINLPLRDPF
jgi:hypothetical protein